MILKRFYDEQLAQASYLIGCAATGSALVVDPNREVDAYVRAAEKEGVEITHVANSTFFAELHLETNDTIRIIDARPSDGIAVALRMDAPIFAADDLLSDPDEESESGESVDTPERKSGEGTRLTADELKAYLEKLRPEDFGDFKL